jgi:hypothetical protein
MRKVQFSGAKACKVLIILGFKEPRKATGRVRSGLAHTFNSIGCVKRGAIAEIVSEIKSRGFNAVRLPWSN